MIGASSSSSQNCSRSFVFVFARFDNRYDYNNRYDSASLTATIWIAGFLSFFFHRKRSTRSLSIVSSPWRPSSSLARSLEPSVAPLPRQLHHAWPSTRWASWVSASWVTALPKSPRVVASTNRSLPLNRNKSTLTRENRELKEVLVNWSRKKS